MADLIDIARGRRGATFGVPAAELASKTQALAQRILRQGPLAARLAKLAINASARVDLDSGLLLETLAQAVFYHSDVKREVTFGESRLDLLFQGPPGLAYVEAKSVNLVEDGIAMFPDAPTIRGTRHLRELAKAVGEGHAAAVCFVVQRDDVKVLRPYAEADPAFAEALASVVKAGVAAYAIACSTTPDSQTPVRLVPVEIASGVFA